MVSEAKDPIVLYLEDDPSSREVMELLLLYDLGLSDVVIWPSSDNFVEKIDNLEPRPDIVFLDIHIQPYDGFEMLRMLRQHNDYHHLPIVAVTASVMNEEVALLKEAGFDGVISKPLDQLAFPELLDRILEGEKIWKI